MSKPLLKALVLLLYFVVYTCETEFFIGSSSAVFNLTAQICLDDGGIIATLVHEYDYNIAREIVTNNGSNVYIGLNKWDNYVNWRYADGTSVKGTYGFDIKGNPIIGNGPWGNNEPDNRDNDEHCVEFLQFMSNNGIWSWNDGDCRSRFPLCMRIETNPIKQLETYIFIIQKRFYIIF